MCSWFQSPKQIGSLVLCFSGNNINVAQIAMWRKRCQSDVLELRIVSQPRMVKQHRETMKLVGGIWLLFVYWVFGPLCCMSCWVFGDSNCELGVGRLGCFGGVVWLCLFLARRCGSHVESFVQHFRLTCLTDLTWDGRQYSSPRHSEVPQWNVSIWRPSSSGVWRLIKNCAPFGLRTCGAGQTTLVGFYASNLQVSINLSLFGLSNLYGTVLLALCVAAVGWMFRFFLGF